MADSQQPEMSDDVRKQLEAMMGKEAMTGEASNEPEIDLRDPSVCRSHLVNECPTETFSNTKWDVEPCGRKHDEHLRERYRNATDEQKREWAFEWEHKDNLEREVQRCDRKIDAAEDRLEKTPEEKAKVNALAEKIVELEYVLSLMFQEIKVYGEIGEVMVSLEEARKYILIQYEKWDLEEELQHLAENGGASGHQKLQVCTCCAAYLSRLDNDRRLADHFFGKLHLGMRGIRQELKDLQEKLSTWGPRREDNYYSAPSRPVNAATPSGGPGPVRHSGRGGAWASNQPYSRGGGRPRGGRRY